ncbi:MAG: ketoacyl-ACP synthase III [Bacteroidia bacterium]|nr:ketoacyl-ACP synthase III [Bacteroidia bacterium]
MAKFSFPNIKIAGIQTVVPKNIIPTSSYKELFGHEEVEKFMQMTGITQTRRTTHYQTASDMGTTAAKLLLEKLSIESNQIGALIMGTTSPDYRRPGSSSIIHKRLGLSIECATFDISLGCSSFVYGIQVAASMMQNSDIDRALLILGDTAGKTTYPKDKASLMLIGECSVAILLERTAEPHEGVKSLLRSDGTGYRYLIVPGGGYRNIDANPEPEIYSDGVERTLLHSVMQGTSVFTFTITDVPRVVKDFFAQTKTSIEDYDCFAFHQANGLILQQIAKKLKFPTEKFPISLDRYGNTSGASAALTLCDKYGNQVNGQIKTLVCGFGVGLSWGIFSATLDVATIFPIVEDDTLFEEGIIQSAKEL